MKFKKIVLLLLGLGALALASCNGGEKKPDTPTTPETPTTPTTPETPTTPTVASQYLKFISDNKLRVDIMNDNLGGHFTYGNAVVESTKEMTISNNTAIGHSGNKNVETYNFVIVTETVENGEMKVSVNVHPGIFADSLDEWLQDIKFTSKKAYVAISTGTVNWTKGLNAEMDSAIANKIAH